MRSPARISTAALVAPTLFLIVLVFAPPSGADTLVPEGALLTDTTWGVSGSPFWVLGNLTVGANATLSVDAGVAVRVVDGASITVAGGLAAVGTQSSPVVFEPNATTQRWQGFVFDSSAKVSALDNVTVRFAAVGVFVRSPLAGITLVNLAIFNTTGGAVEVEDTSSLLSIDGLFLDENPGGISLFRVDNVTITKLTSRNATKYYPTAEPAAFYVRESSDISIRGVQANGSTGLILDSSRVSIEDCAFTNGGLPLSYGLWIQYGAQMRLRDIDLAGFVRGAGIYGVRGVALTNVSARSVTGFPTTIGVDVFGSQQVSATGLYVEQAGLALRAHETEIALDNSSLVASGLEVGKNSLFVVDNLTMEGGVFALEGYGSPAVVKNCNLTGGAAFNIAYDDTWPYGTFEVDLRLGNTVDGDPVLAFFRTPTPAAPVRGGTFAFIYVFGTDGVILDGVTFSGGANRSVWYVNSSGGAVMNSSIPDGLWARHADGLLVENVSVVRGASVEDTSNVLVVDSTVEGDPDAFWGGPGALWLQSVVNATIRSSFVRSNNSWALLASGALSGLWIEDSELEGWGTAYSATEIWATGALRINNTHVCKNGGGSFSLAVRGFEGVWISNLTTCLGGNGAWFLGGDPLLIEDSRFEGPGVALDVEATVQATVRRNVFANADLGISGGWQTTVYENEFWNNTRHGIGEQASWYNATTNRGNFWDTYTGVDANGDGIGDTRYRVIGSAWDLYPLMAPPSDSVPVVSAVFPSTIDEDAAALLDGSASSDEEGIASAWWSITHRGSTQNLSGLTVSFTFDDPGAAQVLLVVTDTWGQRSTAGGSIEVLDRTAPVISPLEAVVVDEGAPLSLTAVATDRSVDWQALGQLTWYFAGGWSGDFFARAGAAEVTVSFATPGTWSAIFEAIDPSGNKASVNFTISVRDITPPAFDLVVSPGAKVPERTGLTLGFENATDEDPAFAAASSVSWAVSGPAGFALSSNEVNLAFEVPAPGYFLVVCTIMDPSGNRGMQSVVLTALDVLPPVWNPPSPIQARDVDVVTLSAEDAHDASGIAFALWRDGAATLGVGLTVRAEFTVPGRHTITLTLEDGLGHSADFQITVDVEDTTRPWLVDPGFNGTRQVAMGSTLRLDARGAFADNDPAFELAGRYLWTSLRGNVEFSSEPRDAFVDLAFVEVGIAELRLRVEDPSGNSVEVDVRFVVADKDPPRGLGWAVQGGAAGGAFAGEVLTFTGMANDTDGSLSFHWEFGDGANATGSAVAHAFAQPGDYRVILRAEDSFGNNATISFDVHIRAVQNPPVASSNWEVVVIAATVGGFAAVALAWRSFRHRDR